MNSPSSWGVGLGLALVGLTAPGCKTDERQPQVDAPEATSTAAKQVEVADAADAADAVDVVKAAATAPEALGFEVLVAPAFGEPAPVEVTPAIPPQVVGMMDHAFTTGWSKDSKEFGYCVVSGGSGGTNCEFMTPAGHSERLNDFDEKKGEPDEPRHHALLARLKERGYAAGVQAWPYARDLTLTWASVDRKEVGDQIIKPQLTVGARVRGEEGFSAAMTLVPPGDGIDWFVIHPEAIAVSPDGKYLGVVSHAYAGEFSDTFRVRILGTGLVAGQAFNDRGLALHQEKKFLEAARWFHQAAHANPGSKVAMYNLACALARAGRPEAEVALRRAIETTGNDTLKKARADDDFASVRGEAWFQKLTAEAKSP